MATESCLELRVASYNVRVDHDADIGTNHDWPLRRPLVASSIRALAADIIGLQEPSPAQAKDLEQDLGSQWGVAVTATDPQAWAAAGASGPSDGQTRDGNGFVWRRSRVELLGEVETIWLSPEPSAPWSVGEDGLGPWGGSKYQRTCVQGWFKDLQGGMKIAAFSAHFDHIHDDDPESDLTRAPSKSAELVMKRACEALKAADLVIVTGDFNTFRDREGACYTSLVAGAGGLLCDVRDAPGCVEVDAGRSDSSWEGWESNAYWRGKKGDQRYDQMFVGVSMPDAMKVRRTAVVEERFWIDYNGERQKVYASDHLPIVTDISLRTP